MLGWLGAVFDTRGFPPRWQCGSVWQTEPWWGWIHIFADLSIWGAYTAIPIVLLWFLRRRPELPFNRLFVMFGLFILACGTTHLLEATIFWWPAYRLSALFKLATAVISCATVWMLIPAIPKALALRSPADLQREIERRTRELQDLTGRLQTEMDARAVVAGSLANSEERLRLALQAGQMGTWDWNLTTDKIWLDPIEEELTGLSNREQGISADDFLQQVVAEDRPELSSLLARARETGEEYRHEFRYRHPAGRIRWLAGRGRIVSEGVSRGHFMGINFDVTERRQTQETLKLRTRAIESATNAILVIDVEQSAQPLVYVNPAFCDLTGFANDDVIGKSWQLLQGTETDAAAVVQLKDAIVRRVDCGVTLLTYRRDGRTFWSDLRISPVVDEHGLTTHFIGVLSDISSRVETEQELLRAREAAESASSAKTLFLANMSHEIRTPLTAILGCAETLYRQTADEDSLSLVKMVKDQGELLLGVLNDVLDVSKIEAGKLEIRVESCALLPIVADVRSLMQPQATEQGLQLDAVYDSLLPVRIHTDPLRLRQILLNLTSNAIKYTNEGSVRIRIRCEADVAPAILIVDVVDTGIGIAADRLETIFEPFTQVAPDATRLASGAGLGLTICRRLVDLLGGELLVESRLGKGSVFTLRLPLGDPALLELRPADEARAAAVEGPGEEPPPLKIPANVLVAEDTRGLQFMLRQMLREFVSNVVVVSNGEEAIEAVRKANDEDTPFDVILMDMQMPVLNGFEATSRLRSLGFDRPIIALTAGAMGGDRQKCLAAGCTDYLTKPIDRSRLLTALVEHCRG